MPSPFSPQSPTQHGTHGPLRPVETRPWKPAEKAPPPPVAFLRSTGGRPGHRLDSHLVLPQKSVLSISSLMPLLSSLGACAPVVYTDGNSAVSHSEYPHSPFQDSEIPSPQLDRF